MVKRAMRWDEDAGESFIADILAGKADPEVPRLITSADIIWEDTGEYARRWFCIVPGGQAPPEPEE